MTTTFNLDGLGTDKRRVLSVKFRVQDPFATPHHTTLLLGHRMQLHLTIMIHERTLCLTRRTMANHFRLMINLTPHIWLYLLVLLPCINRILTNVIINPTTINTMGVIIHTQTQRQYHIQWPIEP